MHMAYGVNSVQAHGFKAGSGSQTAKLKSLAGYNLVWPEEAEEIGQAEFMKLDDFLRIYKRLHSHHLPRSTRHPRTTDH